MKRLQLQLPKDKFTRLAFNIAFIIVWLALGNVFQMQVLLYKSTEVIFNFFRQIVEIFGNTLFWGGITYNLIELIIVWTPIILVTGYIWNGKIKLRPKITRSKD